MNENKLVKNTESSYYDAGGISVIDIWKAKLTNEEFRGLCKGNAIKYIMRAGNKEKNTAVKDIKKAIDYLSDLLTTFEGDNE